MPVTTLNPFSPEAIDANRRGELSDEQLRGFSALSRYNRRSNLSSAGFFLAGALLVVFFASPTSSVVLRTLVTFICLALAVFLFVRSVTGGDALTRDLRRVQVQSVEGAIGKSRAGGGGGRSVTTCFLEVGETSFKVARATYDAAPEAGIVRLYFLPHSRKIVNLERLPNAPLSKGVTTQGIVETLGVALGSHGRRQMNEAKAELAGVSDALKANFVESPVAPPPHARDTRPLGEALVGTWSNALMKVTFSADGRVTTHVLGTKKTGHWSVDGTGRLRADITGWQETADAWVAGDQLTITLEGRGLIFTRESGA